MDLILLFKKKKKEKGRKKATPIKNYEGKINPILV